MLETPQVGSTVLKVVGFGVVTMIGFNSTKAKVGDIAVKITHNGFISRTQI